MVDRPRRRQPSSDEKKTTYMYIHRKNDIMQKKAAESKNNNDVAKLLIKKESKIYSWFNEGCFEGLAHWQTVVLWSLKQSIAVSSVCPSVRQFPTTKAKSQPAASNLHPSQAESFASLSYSWLVCLAKSSQLLKQQRRERLRICQKETSTRKSVVMELLPILTVMGTSSLPLKVHRNGVSYGP